MGSGDNFSTDIPERQHIANVKEAYRSSNKVNYIWQMLEHNDQCTGLDVMEETLSELAVQGWYDIDSAKVFNLPMWFLDFLASSGWPKQFHRPSN